MREQLLIENINAEVRTICRIVELQICKCTANAQRAGIGVAAIEDRKVIMNSCKSPDVDVRRQDCHDVRSLADEVKLCPRVRAGIDGMEPRRVLAIETVEAIDDLRNAVEVERRLPLLRARGTTRSCGTCPIQTIVRTLHSGG